MEKDTLGQVIEAEKEIQKDLEAEKAKARAWLESTKSRLEAEFVQEERKIRNSLELSEAEAVTQAERQAAEIIRHATRAAERLGQLEPEKLHTLLEKKLRAILPG